MNTGTLKRELHEAIENIHDVDLLQLLREMVSEDYHSRGPVKLTALQKAGLEEARREMETGKVHTVEEANELIDQWLEK